MKEQIKNSNIKADFFTGLTACGYIIPLSTCFAAVTGQGLFAVILCCAVCALFSLNHKGEGGFLIPDIRIITVLLCLNAILPPVGAFISVALGGILFIICKHKKNGEIIPQKAQFILSLMLTLSATILLTNIYFGIGAYGRTTFEMLDAYKNLGFHPNFAGLLTGTITLFTMITYPFKFKKLSKIVSPALVTIAIPFLLNLLLNPNKNLTNINESDFLTFSNANLTFDFSLLSILVIILGGFLIGCFLCIAHREESYSFGIAHIFSPFPLRRIQTEKSFGIISTLTVIALTLFLTIFTQSLFTRIPMHSIGSMLIVYAWQNVSFNSFKNKKKGEKKAVRVIATWVITAIMVFVFSVDIFVNVKANHLIKDAEEKFKISAEDKSNDKIHFLNTAHSDCIIIESNGKFALIDSGEGEHNPRRKAKFQGGYEEEVLNYIENHCTNENGEIFFNFAVSTHMHYDHAGNFENIIKHPKIKIGKMYIKEYTGEHAGKTDSEDWGNKQTYEKIIKALNETETPVISEIPRDFFIFGDFKIQFLNAETPDGYENAGENANSIGIKVTKGEKIAFLGADFTNASGFEMLYAKEIGDVDLLKIGHHGYYGSSSTEFLKILKPEITICTNYIGKIYPNVKWNLTMVAEAPVFSTEQRNGIIAIFTDTGKIEINTGEGAVLNE